MRKTTTAGGSIRGNLLRKAALGLLAAGTAYMSPVIVPVNSAMAATGQPSHLEQTEPAGRLPRGLGDRRTTASRGSRRSRPSRPSRPSRSSRGSRGSRQSRYSRSSRPGRSDRGSRSRRRGWGSR